jgi:IS4 transposase
MVFDRYYVDFALWKKIDDSWAFFVSRSKTNTDYTIFESKHVYEPWITQDATIELTGSKWVKEYNKLLRVVKYYDSEWEKIYTYITNNFDLPASTIAKIYLYRWKIEEFFRRIKQNLKIKSFLGTSENAVMNQIWIAMIYYVLLHYLRSTARLWKQ